MMARLKSGKRSSDPRQYGLATGVCKVCDKTFALQKHTKHSKDKVLKGVICSKCGTEKTK